MSEETKSKFKLTNITDLTRANIGDETIIESDLSLQHENRLYQFDMVKKKEEEKYKIEPGVFSVIETRQGIQLINYEFANHRVLGEIKHTEEITNEFHKFFKKLSFYEQNKVQPKRACLLYGVPGVGKSLGISKACKDLVKEDKGTVVINWNSASIRSDSVLDFFSSYSQYSDEVSRVILIIEDIGTGVEGHGGAKEVDRSLLNLLDGAGMTFNKPTFIVATTNYAENLPKPLLRRGRFDKHIKVDTPDGKGRVELLQFIMGKDLSEENRNLIEGSKCKGFVSADLKEIFVRAELDEKSFSEVVEEINKDNKAQGKGFDDRKSMGML